MMIGMLRTAKRLSALPATLLVSVSRNRISRNEISLVSRVFFMPLSTLLDLPVTSSGVYDIDNILTTNLSPLVL